MTSKDRLGMFGAREAPAGSGVDYLARLRAQAIILDESWDELDAATRGRLEGLRDKAALLDALAEVQLITPYVAKRIAVGKTFGLRLGHYRILDRLGAGGMGVVFKAEHVRLRQLAAIKVLPLYGVRENASRHLRRFSAEVRAIAQLRHPNVVRALDVGEAVSNDPDAPVLHYFVMDFHEGLDLEMLVKQRGCLPVAEACGYARQMAEALQEAHRQHLVHRDVKPSNVLVTPEGMAMLLDFGLVRRFHHRMTDPNIALGSFEYIAPEQALDASSVDVRADLYGLGATLYWCLTGCSPFPGRGNPVEEVMQRRTQPPPSVRAKRPELSPTLDNVLRRLLEPDPAKRFTEPHLVVNALLPFVPTFARHPSEASTPNTSSLGEASRERMVAMQQHLEEEVAKRDGDLVQVRNALVLALAELASRRDALTTQGHLTRMQRYCRVLAEHAASLRPFRSQINPDFVTHLEGCVPLKDIGKVGLPDHLLQNPGRLDPDERIIMQCHTHVGAETLQRVLRRHGSAVAFLQMAVDVARHHHERFDGKGYPDKLEGDSIPLAARIVSIADVYDALRSRRNHRPALNHDAALQVITENSHGQFDPRLLQAFVHCAEDFARIRQETPD